MHTRKPPVIHRDIKLENVMLAIGERPADIVVKIANFGISSIDIVDADSTGTSFILIMHIERPLGTYPYMPPKTSRKDGCKHREHGRQLVGD